MAGSIIEVTDNNFQAEVLEADRAGARGLLGSLVRSLPRGRPDSRGARRRARRPAGGEAQRGRQPADRAKYQVMSIPTMLLFKNGEVAHQIVGALPKPPPAGARAGARGLAMPVVTIEWYEGRSAEQKREIAEKLTAAALRGRQDAARPGMDPVRRLAQDRLGHRRRDTGLIYSGVASSTSVPNGSRTYATRWPWGLSTGAASDAQPAARARVCAASTSSATSVISTLPGRPAGSARSTPPSKFDDPSA